MHIRHLVATDNFAGVERYVASIASELARRGHDVEVLGGALKPMRAVLGPAGVNHVAVSSAAQVARANLDKPRPDIVHAHMTAADLAAVVTKPLVRRPIVSTLHFAQPRGHDGLTRWIYRAIPRLVTTQIAISLTVADAVGGRPEVILNGVPAPAEVPGSGVERTPTVLVAQRLEAEKDTATAVRAFAVADLGAKGWELHICGEGSQRTDLAVLAERLGVASSTTFFGRVDDIDRRMSHASVFVASATREPFGLSVVEAMAHGLPVVAASGGAHRETIGSATPETLFPPGEAEAAAAILGRLAVEPDIRADLGRRARRRWEEVFTIEAHVDALEAIYARYLPVMTG